MTKTTYILTKDNYSHNNSPVDHNNDEYPDGNYMKSQSKDEMYDIFHNYLENKINIINKTSMDFIIYKDFNGLTQFFELELPENYKVQFLGPDVDKHIIDIEEYDIKDFQIEIIENDHTLRNTSKDEGYIFLDMGDKYEVIAIHAILKSSIPKILNSENKLKQL